MNKTWNNGEKAFVSTHRGRKGSQKTLGTSASRASMKAEKRRAERRVRQAARREIKEARDEETNPHQP